MTADPTPRWTPSSSCSRDAGLVEVYVDTDNKQAMRITDGGAHLARQMAMSKDADAVLDALPEAQSEA